MGKIVSSFVFPIVTEKIPLKKILSFSLLAQLIHMYIVFALSVFLSGLISDYIGVVYVYYFAFILYFISSIAAAFTFRRESKINKNYDAMNDVNN